MDWVSVKDRLPEKGNDVLIYTFGKVYVGDYLHVKVRDCAVGWWTNTADVPKRYIKYQDKVTHWMPLPDIPKED